MQKAPKASSNDIAWAGFWTLAAMAFRAAPLLSDFWYDEIWSLALARQAGGPLEILLGMPSSANHPLTTLWLFMTKSSGSEPVYRLMSFIMGALCVPAAMLAARRFGLASARVAAALAAFWFPLVVYSTEARGYAGVCLASLLAWGWLGQPRRGLAFSLACCLGLLSHMTFALVYAALLAADVLAAPRWKALPWERHAAPLAVLALFVAPHFLRLDVPGTPPYVAWRVVAEAAGFLWGAPPGPWGALAALALTAACVAVAAPALKASGGPAVLAAALLLSAVLIASRPQALFARYFLGPTCLLLPVLSAAIVRLYQTSSRAAGVGLAGLFMIGALTQWAGFVKFGRGGYREALAYIAAEDSGALIVIASDHDHRNGLLIDYHAPAVPPGRILYAPAGTSRRAGAGWFIAHRLERDSPPPQPEIASASGARFSLERVYPHRGPVGWDWFVYRRVVKGSS